jgi:hypothetical protein
MPRKENFFISAPHIQAPRIFVGSRSFARLHASMTARCIAASDLNDKLIGTSTAIIEHTP